MQPGSLLPHRVCTASVRRPHRVLPHRVLPHRVLPHCILCSPQWWLHVVKRTFISTICCGQGVVLTATSSAPPMCPSLARTASGWRPYNSTPQEGLGHRPVCHPAAISASLMNTPLQVSGNKVYALWCGQMAVALSGIRLWTPTPRSYPSWWQSCVLVSPRKACGFTVVFI